MTIETPMVSVRGVHKFFGNLHVLQGIDLDIASGEVCVILGPSGSGKSTLLRCLNMLEDISAGRVFVDGQLLGYREDDKGVLHERHDKEIAAQRSRIGMVFQAANLLDARTAADNIGYPLKLAGVPAVKRRERVDELLELVGLAGRGDSYPSQLSGGQRQRVGIARALADNPAVLLCDEPTSALDTDSTAQILALLRRVRDVADVTVVVITHEMAVVREICDSVTLLGHGQVLQSGSLAEVVADPATPLARELVPMPVVDSAATPPCGYVPDSDSPVSSCSTWCSPRTRACPRGRPSCAWPPPWART